MITSVTGYPRIGKLRELKFASEKYFRGETDQNALKDLARRLRLSHWSIQKENGISLIPSNDFSFYDTMLDASVLFNIIPKRYQELKLSALDTYYAMARGYQGPQGDVKALAMKKWFNTNYHYLVPEIDDDTEIKLTGTKPIDEFLEAKEANIQTKPVIVGPFTFLKLARFTGQKGIPEVKAQLSNAYAKLTAALEEKGAEWIQFDEPCLVMDLTPEDLSLFKELYLHIFSAKGGAKLLLQTYFGDVRDCYGLLCSLDFDGIGLDFCEGSQTLSLVKEQGFPDGKLLFAGVVNGKNIWKNHYDKTLELLSQLSSLKGALALSTSCSLLHVPYTLENEEKLSKEHKAYFAFAEEKLKELNQLSSILEAANPQTQEALLDNRKLFELPRCKKNEEVHKRLAALKDSDFVRLPAFEEREELQRKALGLPKLPTTTIGSFPQTADVRANRAAYKKGTITRDQYTAFNREKIKECIKLQEELDLDVLVHGEYERNDMVEYFGEQLDGYVFTEKAWVQSYGTRCVKPPVIWGDICRLRPMTTDWSVYAQSLTDRPVKGMLTGPVTILNWSFPREDISLKESALQIALAIQDEVLDLEAGGIKIIQIDEAALREKLPLRRSDWASSYLDWAIPAFRLVHSKVKAETQIHTHMCYSEFNDIIREIDSMDADVITFEASRSDLTLLDALKENHFKTEVGPGVYDIHSPRIPSVEEIKNALEKMLEKLPSDKLWVNPDCGLKTRGTKETAASLKNMVIAAKELRKEKGL